MVRDNRDATLCGAVAGDQTLITSDRTTKELSQYDLVLDLRRSISELS